MAAPLKGKRSMSFLTPKRRKTTANLPTVNGLQVNGDAPVPPVPSLGSPISERPAASHRPVSQPVIPSVSNGSLSNGNSGGDGNLFYAYARKGDDLKSRYLLTFASAFVANEWWLHLQTNFPDATRPGAQLFSFKTDDLLSKAWRHPSFAHLKSKWMYISFSEAPEEGIGGAAQGIIPVQDAEGNMLGGGAPASPESVGAEIRKEARRVKTEVQKLEDHFERMMAAVERNTEKVAELATRPGRSASDVVSFNVDSDAGSAREGSFDMGVLSGHFVRMNDLLSRNSQHVEELTKKHFESEARLKEAIETLDARQNHERLDMQQLVSHLDRIQSMMESSVKERKDSAREAIQQPSQPLQVDFSPLTERLGKVQEAVEQNSELIKALLNEGDEKASTPFWGKEAPPQTDLSPLTQHLERINSAIEQQSEHVKALVGYASGETSSHNEENDARPSSGLADMNEHLEQIYNAIEEGNNTTRQWQEQSQTRSQDNHLAPLEEHLSALREQSERGNDHMQQLISSQKAVQESVEARGGAIDMTPLAQHLEGLREQSEKSNDHMEQLVSSQDAVREAVEANGGEIDFSPLAELLDAIRESTDSNAEVVRQLLESQEATRKESAIDFGPLKEHLEAIRSSTDNHAERVRSLLESQQNDRSPSLDLSPLTDRLNSIHATLQKRPESPGTGDGKFLINALASHLSKIQGVTEQNAQHVKALREKQSSTSDKMHTAVSETTEQVRSTAEQVRTTTEQARVTSEQVGALFRKNAENEARIDAQNSQMRELMSGQREMVEVMRSLAKSVVAQTKGACDHVVVPPPRKMGKKIVGFVYDAKEGMP